MSQNVFTIAPSMTFFITQNVIEGQISCSVTVTTRASNIFSPRQI
jgi:hypothetical protein